MITKQKIAIWKIPLKVMPASLEALGMDQRVDQVAEKADRDGAAEDVVEQHWKCSLHAVAGREIGEANAEEAQGQDQPDHIEHVGLRTPPAERDHPGWRP